MGYAIYRWPKPGPVGSDARLAPERSPRLAASVTHSCCCRPGPSPARRRYSFRTGLAVSAVRGERKRSQTLTQKEKHHGNPKTRSLKSASVASRPRSGATEPKSTRGTTSPSPVFTKTAISGRVRRASGATICWCLRKWPIRPTRASSSFRRKKPRRSSPSVRQASESGGAGPRRSPILRQGEGT